MTNLTKSWTKKLRPLLAPSWNYIFGFIWLLLGVLTSIWTPYRLLLEERLRMRPGLPPYDWWVDPPNCYMTMYIYNITNAQRFLNGYDARLVMEEIGPIVFREVWKHENVVFNDNSTITYRVDRKLIYLEEKNHYDLNATIVVPNIAVLAVSSYAWDKSFITKMGLDYLFRTLNAEPIVETTIYNYLYNNADPLLKLANTFLPSFMPLNNIGLLKMIYKPLGDNVTAYMGTGSGHKLFSLMERYNGDVNFPGQNDSCKYKVTNSTEAITLNQFITKDQVLKYYRNHMCRTVNLHFEEEGSAYGLKTYKFSPPDDEFKRIVPKEEDCFDSHPSLPDGMSDVSKCYFSFPFTVNFVHVTPPPEMYPVIKRLKEELRVPTKCHIEVHPVTGIPVSSNAAIQANINVRKLSGFSKPLDRFSNQFVPIFWLALHNNELPFKVVFLMYVIVSFQYIGWILTVAFFTAGMYCVWKAARRKSRNNRRLNEKDINSNGEAPTAQELESCLRP